MQKELVGENEEEDRKEDEDLVLIAVDLCGNGVDKVPEQEVKCVTDVADLMLNDVEGENEEEEKKIEDGHKLDEQDQLWEEILHFSEKGGTKSELEKLQEQVQKFPWKTKGEGREELRGLQPLGYILVAERLLEKGNLTNVP